MLALLLACTTPPGPPVDTGDPVVHDTGDDSGLDTADPLAPPTLPATQRAPGARPPPHPDVDVLIVGAGAAGLAAANEALHLGASVMVLEREETVGGAAMWAAALMLYSGTPQQAAVGIVDSPVQLLSEWPSFTGGDVDDPWVQYFASSNVPEVYDWLADRGVTWMTPMGDPSAGTTPRIHEVVGGGPALIAALAAGVPEEDLRLQAEAVDLSIVDGRAQGVVWTDRVTGETVTTTAGAIVLATGGFMHDLDRVRLERPDLADDTLLYDSWPGDDGNGLRLLESYGATVQNLQAVGLYAHSVPDPDGGGDGLPIPYAGQAMWLNADGERFADEFQTNSFLVGQALADQPGGTAWVISDADVSTVQPFGSTVHGNVYTMNDLVMAGTARTADDFGALAADIGLDPAALTGQAEAFTRFALGLDTDPFRTDPAFANPLDHHPYYAVPMAVGVAKGFGGVDVDLAGRVLTSDGLPIPGAYAAGELTGMAGGSLVGDYGFTGSLSAVVLSGRVAGAAAAHEALGR